MRKTYMILYIRGTTEITHIDRKGTIEVTFEQACTDGFNSLVTDIDGNILSRIGFNDSDVAFYLSFLDSNREGIILESRGEI